MSVRVYYRGNNGGKQSTGAAEITTAKKQVYYGGNHGDQGTPNIGLVIMAENTESGQSDPGGRARILPGQQQRRS
jgi:hypothetical protein